MGRATAVALVALFLANPAAAQGDASDRAARVSAFARIMAEVRTADERCDGVSAVWPRLADAKDALHLEEVDYFAYRAQAHDLAEAIVASIAEPTARAAWCDAMVARYGATGTVLPDAVTR